MGFFDELQQIKELSSRTSEAMGGVFSDPFNEVATVISVSDPKKLGRVKVEYQDGTTSDWVYVLGNGKGLLSAQLIGSSCLIGKAHGNSNDAFVIGFFNKDPNVSSGGAPVQLTLLDEQVNSYRSPQSPGDQGLRCNKGNAGRVYLLQNEVNQDVVVCVRRNNPQDGGEEVWNWKSLTNSKWVEKGFDPGLQGDIATNYSEKKGIPECNEAMDGDVRNFTEDRKFRDFQIKCGKDENGDWNWKPNGATPVFFRTTLPECTEKLHGMDAVLDEGLNSQRISCLRYQGQMKWVNPGKREPIQFHRNDAPLSKIEFLDRKKPVEGLSGDTSGGMSTSTMAQVLDVAGFAVSATGTDPTLRAALVTAGAIPPAFDGSALLRDIATIVVANAANTDINSVVAQLASAVERGGVIDDDLQAILTAAGNVGKMVADGITSNSLDESLEMLGRSSLNSAVRSLPSQVAGVYSAYMSGGALGAIDATVLLGLSQLPDEVSKFVAPVWNVGKSIINSKPTSINDVLTSALGISNTGLSSVVNSLVSVAGGSGNLPSQLSTSIPQLLSSGGLGPIAQMAGSFSNLPGLSNLGGLDSVPQLATTALQLVGLGEEFSSLLGNGGIGFDFFQDLAGINPVSSILSGVPGLSSALSGIGGGECPCDPKCRKTKHSEDSDGNVLLEKCGNVIANSHSSYAPEGDPTKNNENEVAKILNLIPTALGEALCIGTDIDLTQLIQNVKRLDEMSDRINSAKNADWPELWTELMYTFETIEKAFKQADNNITTVESIERKLIDATFRYLNKMMIGDQGYFPRTLKALNDANKSIRDLYNYTRRLDAVKNGGHVGVFITEPISATFNNISAIPLLSAVSRKEAEFITNNFLRTADREWRTVEPGGGLVSISSFILGSIPIDVPIFFDKCQTKIDKNEALKQSLESKINSPIPARPGSLTEAKLPNSITDAARRASGTGTIDPRDSQIGSILDQIRYQQGRARSGEAEC